jgi:hypothetical protein
MIEQAHSSFDDLLVVDHNALQRTLVGLKGHYTLDGWRDAKGQVRKFECEILKVSPHMMKLSAPVTGAVGNRIVVEFKKLGKFEGHIIQILPRVVIMKIFGTIEDSTKVANKLAWITDPAKAEARRYPRIIPTNPDSTIVLPGDAVLPCQIIDYSASGAAVYADANPAIGTVVKIGALLGRVVRQFGGGFAVAFPTIKEPRQVEASIVRPSIRCEPE